MHRASVEAADAFFTRHWPGAQAIADPDGVLYEAFGLRRGSWWQVLGPRIWWRGLTTMFRGNFASRPTGHVMQMPGAFLVHGEHILWQHRARDSADHPDLDRMLAALRQNR